MRGVYVYQHKQVASKIQLLNVFLMRSQIKMENGLLEAKGMSVSIVK